MKFKAVIFDMDGVLVNSEVAYRGRRLKFMQQKGIDASNLSKNFFVGGKMRDLWPVILGDKVKDYDLAKLQDEYMNFRQNERVSYKKLIFPDVLEILQFLQQKNYKVALASSSDHQQIQEFFTETDTEKYFDLVCSGEDFKEAKPNPEIYLTAIKKLGFPLTEDLIIEDSTIGIAAGKAAHATVWGIRDTEFGIDQSQADRLFDNLHQIKVTLQENE